MNTGITQYAILFIHNPKAGNPELEVIKKTYWGENGLKEALEFSQKNCAGCSVFMEVYTKLR